MQPRWLGGDRVAAYGAVLVDGAEQRRDGGDLHAVELALRAHRLPQHLHAVGHQRLGALGLLLGGWLRALGGLLLLLLGALPVLLLDNRQLLPARPSLRLSEERRSSE